MKAGGSNGALLTVEKSAKEVGKILSGNLKCGFLYIKISIVIMLSFFSTALYAGEITLNWKAPQVKADGTPIEDLAGFKIYYGTASGIYSNSTDVGYVTTARISNLKNRATYYFAATAYDSFGIESGYSNEVSMIIGLNPPSAPQLMFPTDYQIDVDTTVEFMWEGSVDPDGDMIRYDLYVCEDVNFTQGCIIESDIAFISNKDIFYAGFGIYGPELFIFGIVISLASIARKKNKMLLFVLMTVTLGIFLVSCGGGLDVEGSGIQKSADSRTLNEVISMVSGLKHRTTYYWKVVAYDSTGGEAVSSVWSFTTL